MQKLLLELGAPLVIAFVLLAIAKFVRGIIGRFRKPPLESETENEEDHPG
jgi:hypothetical protein